MLHKNQIHVRALAQLPTDEALAIVSFARHELRDESNTYSHARALAREYSDKQIEKLLNTAKKDLEKREIQKPRPLRRGDGEFFNPNPKARSDEELRKDILSFLEAEEELVPFALSKRLGSSIKRTKRILTELENEGSVEVNLDTRHWKLTKNN